MGGRGRVEDGQYDIVNELTKKSKEHKHCKTMQLSTDGLPENILFHMIFLQNKFDMLHQPALIFQAKSQMEGPVNGSNIQP